MGMASILIVANQFHGASRTGQSVSALKSPSDGNGRQQELGEAKGKTKDLEYESSVALNDPALSQAWGFKKSDAQKAQSISQGNRSIVVAVIDTGADLKHEDLILASEIGRRGE